MSAKVAKMLRTDTRDIIANIEDTDFDCKGIVVGMIGKDDKCRYMFSGFDDRHGALVLAGLLRWMETDILGDLDSSDV